MQIDWSNIDTVLLDMDGTLLDLHFDNHFWQTYMPKVYAEKNGITLDQTWDILKPMFVGWAGQLEWYCVDHWSNVLELDIMALKRDVAGKIAYRPNAEAFLLKCQQETNDVRMVTNGHRKVLELKMEFTDIHKYFDHLVCSHELDHPKEEQAFWQRLQVSSPFDPDRTLFIDDNETVLVSAADYGIKHLYSIKQPDSVKPRDFVSAFPMIEEFHVD